MRDAYVVEPCNPDEGLPPFYVCFSLQDSVIREDFSPENIIRRVEGSQRKGFTVMGYRHWASTASLHVTKPPFVVINYHKLHGWVKNEKVKGRI